MVKVYRKVNRKNLTPPEPKPGIDHANPIGPEKPTAKERFASDHPWIAKAATAVKKRSNEVANDVTGPNSFRGTVSPATRMPSPDPFGIGRANRSGGMNPFGGVGVPFGPMQQRPPAQERQERTSSRGSTRTIYKANGDVEVIHAGIKTSKRKKPREPAPTNIFADPFHVPKNLKHMF